MLAQTSLYSNNWKQNMPKMCKLLLSSSAALLTSDWTYRMWVIKSNNRRVSKTVEKGNRLQEIVSDDKFIPRFRIMRVLERILQSNENQSSYYIINGEHGSGKTTLIRRIANDIGKGIVYVDVPEDLNKFNDEFGKAINYIFKEDAINSMLIFQLISWLKQKVFGYSNEDNNNNKNFGKITIYFYFIFLLFENKYF